MAKGGPLAIEGLAVRVSYCRDIGSPAAVVPSPTAGRGSGRQLAVQGVRSRRKVTTFGQEADGQLF